MKLFKSFVLCSAVIVSLIFCSTSCASLRLGVASVSFYNTKGSPFNYQKDIKKYRKIIADVFSEFGAFEPILISDQEYGNTYAEVSGFSGSGSYQRTMTGTADNSKLSELMAETLRKLAEKKNCRYMLEVYATYFSDADGNRVVTQMSLFDARSEESTSFYSERPVLSSSSKNVPSTEKNTDKKSSKRTSKKAKTNSKSKSEINSNAIEQTATEALRGLITQMQDKLMGGGMKIANIEGDKITLDRGTSSGVGIGDYYRIYTEVSDGMDEIFGADKNSAKRINLAFIKVTNANENSSVAEIVKDGGNIAAIRTDDKLEPVMVMLMNAELKAISEGTIAAFPSQHPEVKKVEVKQSASTTKSQSVSKSKNEPLPALPNGVMRIDIVNFENKANGFLGSEASAFTDLLSRMLSNSEKIVVLERDRLDVIGNERKLNLAGILDPDTAAQIGKLASCQYILMGSVTSVEAKDTISGRYIRPKSSYRTNNNYNPNMSRTTAGVLLGLEIIGMMVEASNAQKENVVTETHEVITTVDVRLVNVTTGKIEMAFTEQGSAAQSDVVTQDGNGNIKGVEANYGSLEGQSVASAAANLSYKIREKLVDEPVQISSVNNSEFIINRGSSSGIQIGDLFCVYSENQSGGDTEAVISVKDVQESFSVAELAKSLSDSYVVAVGSRLEPVLHGDFQRGIWHVKNQKRANTSNKQLENISLEDLQSKRHKRFENVSTEAKKVIKSYGLKPQKEKILLSEHSRASKANNAKKKYEAYKKISDDNPDDFLAAYNTGKYALEQSMYVEAREWASKALFFNPNYKPAKDLIDKIDNGD